MNTRLSITKILQISVRIFPTLCASIRQGRTFALLGVAVCAWLLSACGTTNDAPTLAVETPYPTANPQPMETLRESTGSYVLFITDGKNPPSLIGTWILQKHSDSPQITILGVEGTKTSHEEISNGKTPMTLSDYQGYSSAPFSGYGITTSTALGKLREALPPIWSEEPLKTSTDVISLLERQSTPHEQLLNQATLLQSLLVAAAAQGYSLDLGAVSLVLTDNSFEISQVMFFVSESLPIQVNEIQIRVK